MRQLIWKELREQRFVPFIYGAVTMLVIAAWYGASAWLGNHHHDPSEILTAKETPPGLVMLLCCAGVISGSGAISPEIGRGTISFLSILPNGRRSAWTAKLVAGLLIVALTVTATLIGYFVDVFVLFGRAGLDPIFVDLPALPYPVALVALISGCCLLGFSVCLLASTLVDRTIVASTLGLVGGVGILGAVESWINNLSLVYQKLMPGANWLMVSIPLFLSVIFLWASHAGFCSGEGLLSGGRVTRALGIAGAGMAVLLVCLGMVDASVARTAETKSIVADPAAGRGVR